MEEHKNKPWKKGILQPEKDFTLHVMQKIEAEEEALVKLLSKHGKLAPSEDFTAHLMHQLEGKTPAPLYAPLISKKAWIGIAAVCVGIILLTFIGGTESYQENGFENSLQNLSKGIQAAFAEGSIWLYLMIGLLILSLGLMIEQKGKNSISEK